MASAKKIRVLLAKPGLDGHDRGIKMVAVALRDAGMEVIYMGRHQPPAHIVETAIQEDVEFIGLSNLSGSYKELFGKVVQLLKDRGAEDIRVMGGGIIVEEDIPVLEAMNIKVFPVGSSTRDIVTYVQTSVG